MKYLLSFYLLLIYVSASGQDIELQGRFGASFIGGETIEFVGRDSFYFGGFYCTYGIHGKGTCEIRNGYLYLYFEKNRDNKFPPLQKPPIIVQDSSRNNMSEIRVTVVDQEGHPIPHATVMIGDPKEQPRTGVAADSAGLAILKIHKSRFPVAIQTTAVYLESGYLKLEKSADYTITMFHRQDPQFEEEKNNGEVFVYEIDEISEDMILMRPEYSSGPFRKYRKK